MKRSGTADLPLHYGRVPAWLAQRMESLGREIMLAVMEQEGTAGVLTRLSDPFWFQALGAVMGMDWHSSGITTSVMGALKRGLNPLAQSTGLFFCGGRGKQSLATPGELTAIADQTGLNGHELVRASRLSAKVDNTCIQDGFALYLHCFVLSRNGAWTVVQQGMNDTTGMARRYHWHSQNVKDFVSDPQTGVVGHSVGTILNLSDSRASKARSSIVEFMRYPVETQLREIRCLTMPAHHEVSRADVNEKRLGAVLALAHEKQFATFTDTLLLPGVGPRTIQSLALVSEVVYGEPCRFKDPARFAFAHGGKDGHPFPVPLKVYDESIRVLRNAVERAKIGQTERLRAIKVLHGLATRIEKTCEPHANVEKVIQHERQKSAAHGGRTVFDKKKGRPARAATQRSQQLCLDI